MGTDVCSVQVLDRTAWEKMMKLAYIWVSTGRDPEKQRGNHAQSQKSWELIIRKEE